MEEQPARKDTKVAIIVIIAGLLTGAVLTYVFLKPDEPQPRYSPEFRVADSQRIPLGSAEAAPASAEGAEADSATDEAAPESSDGENAGSESDAAAAATDPAPTPESAERTDGGESGPSAAESTASERKTIEETRERMESQGVTDYVELTEDLYVRVSAKMVIMASALSHSTDENTDPAEVQGMLADNAAEVLADARIDPEEFWAYTRDVHADPERAKAMGEKILREAEKHTRYKITVEDVPGMEATPVAGADQ